MNTVQNGTKLVDVKQELFYRYLANMKRDEDGNRISMDDFAKKIGVDRKTLYGWQNLPTARQVIADYVDEEFLAWLPEAGLIAKKYAAKGSYQHLQLIVKQAGRLKADKNESKQEVEHSGSVKVEGLDDAELEAKLEQIISQRQA